MKQTNSTTTYTHNFSVHSHYTEWKVPTLIVQYTQVLKKNIQVVLLLSQEYFTELEEVSNFSILLNNTIKQSNGIPTLYNSTTSVDPNTIEISTAQAHLTPTKKFNLIQAGLCFICGKQGHISCNCPGKQMTEKKGKSHDKPCILELNTTATNSPKIILLKDWLAK